MTYGTTCLKFKREKEEELGRILVSCIERKWDRLVNVSEEIIPACRESIFLLKTFFTDAKVRPCDLAISVQKGACGVGWRGPSCHVPCVVASRH